MQHQNRFAFKHNKASRKTAKILALPNEGLCTKCHDIIEWRKQFRKYKPLSTPRRCQICDQKKVTRAYHNICDHCATDTNTCAKCRESKVIVNPIITPEQEKADMDLVRGTMATMSERERRTFVRTLNANKPDKKDPAVTGDEEDYWAPEEEIDWVKAARLLRSLEAMKLEKAEANNKQEDDGDQEGEQEGEGQEGEKKGAKDVKQTNSDPSIEKDDNDDEEGDDEDEDME